MIPWCVPELTIKPTIYDRLEVTDDRLNVLSRMIDTRNNNINIANRCIIVSTVNLIRRQPFTGIRVRMMCDTRWEVAFDYRLEGRGSNPNAPRRSFSRFNNEVFVFYDIFMNFYEIHCSINPLKSTVNPAFASVIPDVPPPRQRSTKSFFSHSDTASESYSL